MRRLIVFAVAGLLWAGAAQAADAVKATAPDKMMPVGAGDRMRACDKKAMDAGIKMEDRAAFVRACMGMK